MAQPDDPVLFTFFNEVGIIDQLARTAFQRELPKGMTVPQFSVLNHFVRLGQSRTPAELASAFQVSRATMTNTLQRLAAAGLIEERPHPEDGRSRFIHITQDGRAMRNECVRRLAPVLSDLAQRIDLDQVAGILPALQTLRAELDHMRDPPRDAD